MPKPGDIVLTPKEATFEPINDSDKHLRDVLLSVSGGPLPESACQEYEISVVKKGNT